MPLEMFTPTEHETSLIYRLEVPDARGPYQTRADGRLPGNAAFRALATELKPIKGRSARGCTLVRLSS